MMHHLKLKIPTARGLSDFGIVNTVLKKSLWNSEKVENHTKSFTSNNLSWSWKIVAKVSFFLSIKSAKIPTTHFEKKN